MGRTGEMDMLIGTEAAIVTSTRDRLGEEAYRELSGYYRTLVQSPLIQRGIAKNDKYLADLEKECSHKVLD